MGRPPSVCANIHLAQRKLLAGSLREYREKTKLKDEKLKLGYGEGNKKGRSVNLLEKLYCSNPRKS